MSGKRDPGYRDFDLASNNKIRCINGRLSWNNDTSAVDESLKAKEEQHWNPVPDLP